MSKLIFLESQVPNGQVVTTRFSAKHFETEVLGTQLDGWTVASCCLVQAANTHRSVVRLATEAGTENRLPGKLLNSPSDTSKDYRVGVG